MSRPMVIDGPVTQVDASTSIDAKKYGLLRDEYDATYGWRTWMYVKNAEASTAWAAGTVVMNKTTTSTPGQGLVCATSTSVHRVLGVAQHAIAAGSAGWILVRGLGLVLADASGFTADTGLIPDDSTAGCAKDVSGATAVSFATALATNAGSTTAVAFIRC